MSVYDWFRLAHDTPFIVASPVATLLAYGVRKRSIQHSAVSIQPLTQTRRFRALFGSPFCVAPSGALGENYSWRPVAFQRRARIQPFTAKDAKATTEEE